MKKMAKKIVASMLACCLVLGLNPAAALATGGRAASSENAPTESATAESTQADSTAANGSAATSVGESTTVHGVGTATASTTISLIGQDDTEIPDDQLDTLYANQDAAHKNVFDAMLLGSFDKAAELDCVPATDEVQAAFAQLGAGHGTAESPSYAVGQTWQLSATTATPDAAAVEQLKSITLRIPKELYDAATESGDFRIAALEDGQMREISGAELKVETDGLTEPVYYVVFPSSNVQLGSYALMYKSNKSATVTATAGEGGSVNPAGAFTYAVSDLDASLNTVRFTFTADDGYELSSVTVNGEAVTVETNFYDLALEAGATYALAASFARVTNDDQHGDVKMRAVAAPADGNAVRDGQFTLSVGTAGNNPETFAYGAPATAEFTATGLQVDAVLVATVPDNVDLAYPSNVPAEGDPAWKPASVLGHTYYVGALTANTVVKFIYKDGPSAADRQQFTVTVAPTQHGTATVQGSGTVYLGDTAVIDVVPDAHWEVATATLVQTRNGQAVAGTERDVFDEACTGQVRIKNISSDYRFTVTFRAFELYYVSAVTRGGTVSPSSMDEVDGAVRGPIRVAQGAGPVSVQVQAKDGYVIDVDRSSLPSGVSMTGLAASEGKSAVLSLPFTQAGATHMVSVAFKLDTSGDDSEWVDINVEVQVDVQTSTGRAEGAAPAESGEKGGTVEPLHVTLRRGETTSQAFRVYPNDGYDIKAIRYTTTGNAADTVTLRPGDAGLTLLTQSYMEQTAQAADAPAGGLFALFSGAGGDEGAAGTAGEGGSDAFEVVFGYEFTVSGITQSMTVYVDFEPAEGKEWGAKDTVMIDASEGGFISPSGEMRIPAGFTTDVDLTVGADAGYRLQNLWLIADGRGVDVKDQVVGGHVQLTLSKGMKVYAQFAKATAQVTVVAPDPALGTITPCGTLQLPIDEPYTFYLKPAADNVRPGYLKVTYDDGTVVRIPVPEGQVSATVPRIEEGMTIEAEFIPGARPEVEWVTLTVLGTSGGSFAEGAGTFDYPKGADAKLTIMPDDGFMLEEWNVLDSGYQPFAGASYSAADNLLTIAGMDRDLTVEALFKKVRFHTITFESENEGGGVQVDGMVDGKLVVLDGQQVTVMVVPDTGYAHDGVPQFVETEDGEDAQGLFALFATPRSTTINYDADTGVASFTAVSSGVFKTKWRALEPAGPDDPTKPDDPNDPSNPDDSNDPSNPDQPTKPYDFYIEASAGDHGTIEPSGRVGVYAGNDAVFTLKPDAGYQVRRVVIDGSREIVGARTQYVFTDVQAAHAIRVEFEARVPAGANDAVSRAVKRLQALASTGDTALTGAVGLLAVAFGAAGVAVLVRRRRQRDDE